MLWVFVSLEIFLPWLCIEISWKSSVNFSFTLSHPLKIKQAINPGNGYLKANGEAPFKLV